jgi:hypothetical protein
MGRRGGRLLKSRPRTAAAARWEPVALFARRTALPAIDWSPARKLSRLALLLLASAAAAAQTMPVPLNRQTVMFKRVFEYDRTLGGKSPRVLVVHDGGMEDLHDLLASFEFAKIEAVPVHYSQLGERINGATVAYILPGVPAATYLDRCAENAVLTISGLPSLVQKGHVSIAIGAGQGRAEILVHLGRLKAEKHDISAELLKLARVLQ